VSETVSTRIDWRWRAIATCFWIGYFPVAPATACSLVVTLVVWLTGGLESTHYYWFVPLITIIAIPVASVAERMYGHDGREIVVDEVAGQMIALLFLPPSATTFVLGFFLFRLFDILKPFPAGRAQRLPSGLGVVMDDVFAGIYANLALRLILYVT
jgi:phosphatidylglycerophosphatase A